MDPDFSKRDYLAETTADTDNDALGRLDLAQGLADILARADPPFVYAICGRWGSGKSTFLRYLVDALHGAQTYSGLIYFNALEWSVYGDLRNAFIYSFLGQIQQLPVICRKERARQLVEENVSELLELAEQALFAKEAFGKLLIKGIKAFREADGVKILGEDDRSLHRGREQIQRLTARLGEEGLDLYVLIDELDRCSPQQVVALLEAIKGMFIFPDEVGELVRAKNDQRSPGRRSLLRFIITMDESYVARCYSSVFDLDRNTAYRYLDKFIHSKFHLPSVPLDRLVEVHLKPRWQADWFPEEGAGLADLLETLKLEDPRSVKRALNYLLQWQERLYPEPPNGRNLCALIDKCSDGEEDRPSLLQRTNEILLIWAVLKIRFPQDIDRIIDGTAFRQQILSEVREHRPDRPLGDGALHEEDRISPLLMEALAAAQKLVWARAREDGLDEEKTRSALRRILDLIFES